MNYTTTDNVRARLHGVTTYDDGLIDSVIVAASRAIDRELAGVDGPASDNYLKQETISLESCRAVIGTDYLLIHPHKPTLQAVTAINWRFAPWDVWHAVDMTTDVEFDTWKPVIRAWIIDDLMGWRGKLTVQVSYTGGICTDTSLLSDLPDDIIELASLLATRYYHEDTTGVSDAIGVAKLGVLVYRKDIPSRFLRMIQTYKRKVPW